MKDFREYFEIIKKGYYLHLEDFSKPTEIILMTLIYYLGFLTPWLFKGKKSWPKIDPQLESYWEDTEEYPKNDNSHYSQY